VKKKTILFNHTSGEVKVEVIFSKRGEEFFLLEAFKYILRKKYYQSRCELMLQIEELQCQNLCKRKSKSFITFSGAF
jgi:hypothetical protein